MESLKKTFESLLNTTYSHEHKVTLLYTKKITLNRRLNHIKLLFVIADGIITGAGNDKPTPQIVLDLLGVPNYVQPTPRAYQALGEGIKQLNMAKIYSGFYADQGESVPYLVVVKTGVESEVTKPGNRYIYN